MAHMKLSSSSRAAYCCASFLRTLSLVAGRIKSSFVCSFRPINNSDGVWLVVVWGVFLNDNRNSGNQYDNDLKSFILAFRPF